MSSSELYLISKVINDKDMSVPIKAGVKADHMVGEWSTIWKWMTEYNLIHGAVPTQRVFAQEYGDITLYDGQDVADEPYTRLIDEIMSAYRKRCLLDALQPAIAALNADDLETATTALSSG